MKLSITQKLVCCFVGLTAVVLVATLSLARWSFQQGFLDYVNALEQVRLERLASDLASVYAASGNDWERVRERFDKLHRRSLPPRPGRPPPLAPDDVAPPTRAPPPGSPPPGRGPESPLPGPGRGLPLAGPPTALFDAAGELIAGPASVDERVFRVPVLVNAVVVGELRSSPKRQLNSPQETAFARQQLIASLAIGIAALLTATVISLWLARTLLSPIRQMFAGIAALSCGDYGVRLAAQRDDELGRLMKDLNRLAETLENTQLSRRRWLADISHELRTPVTILVGELEAIRDGVRRFDSNQLRSFEQEVQRLGRLIDDLYQLALADLGALRYQFAPVNLAACLESWLRIYKPRAEQLGLQLTLSAPASIWIDGDENRMTQLLTNLGNNSLTYTDVPGRITIDATESAGQVSLVVEDTAPGADPAVCNRLFDPLYRQEESRNRRSGGAGLGLAICQNIVHAHGGTIHAAPSPLGGLAIKVILPSRSPPE